MNLKEVKQRIISIKSTQKITSAMKLVSAAKLRRSQSAIEGMRPYHKKLNEIFALSLSGSDLTGNTFVAPREVKRVVVIAMASDTGLCGVFNSNIVRLARETIDRYVAEGAVVEVMPIGRKMTDAVKKMGVAVIEQQMPPLQAPYYRQLSSIASELMERFYRGEIDRVELVYTQFRSASKLLPLAEPMLPIDLPQAKDSAAESVNSFILEPGKAELLSSLLPKVVSLHLYTAFLDSSASEHSARMIAMQAATDNAQDLISELTLEYNKGRQQAITNEILDIVAGSNS